MGEAGFETSHWVPQIQLTCMTRNLQKKQKQTSKGCHMAVGQNQCYHFGVGAPPMLVYFSGDWDVHWGPTGAHFSPTISSMVFGLSQALTRLQAEGDKALHVRLRKIGRPSVYLALLTLRQSLDCANSKGINMGSN